MWQRPALPLHDSPHLSLRTRRVQDRARRSVRGPVGERREIDGWTATSTVSDATGTVIRSGPWSGPLPGPGIYRLRATNTNVAVGLARGTATYDGTFDTRNGETSLAMFKVLRIVDAHGVQTSRVSRGQAATLVVGSV